MNIWIACRQRPSLRPEELEKLVDQVSDEVRHGPPRYEPSGPGGNDTGRLGPRNLAGCLT
jgi:hypothetical protein